MDVKYEDILEDVKTRDYNDMHRDIAPLKQADDAILADTTEIDLQGSIDLIVKIIKENS
jgi:cytidylate kinase